MIQIIGIMIGAYIFVHAAEIFFAERPAGPQRKVMEGLAVILALIDVVCVLGLLSSRGVQ